MKISKKRLKEIIREELSAVEAEITRLKKEETK